MTERQHALRLAKKVLETPYRDPDDDLSVLSRQFLRAIEEIIAEDGFYIVEVNNCERVSFNQLSQEEAGFIAGKRVEKMLRKSAVNH